VTRIAARFAELKHAGRGALIPFLEAWDPDQVTSMAILRGMPAAGADLIEIGMPFTDPMADGPIIQAAGKRGLKAGVKVRHVLTMVREFRQADAATPVILMGYLNPILSYGPEKFCVDAAAAGVDGLIIVDLPPEESDMLLPFAKANGLDFIRLVASEHLAQAIPRIRQATDLPIAIGFGVRTPAQAAEASRIADAAVVASALIETLSHHLDESGNARPEAVATVLAQVRGLAAAVRQTQG
jgi:tryptophan synthase alpha chain